jgi:hypothetical protein
MAGVATPRFTFGGCMLIPDREDTIENLIDKAHEARPERPRPHMGASMLGSACERKMWLSFRWAVQPKFSGRILRLFRRGHQEEPNIIKDLRAAGIVVRPLTSQEGVNFGCHVSGSIDAIIERGVPEAPDKKHIGEFKTHSLKSFNDVEAKGVEKSKPEHYAQMQVYMHGTGIDRALYVAVCKDNDRIYTERVRYDKEMAEKLVARGKRVALSERMPPPISTDPSWFQCKFCDAHSFCHETKLTQHVNCRTCAHSTPKDDSTWHCERYDAPIEVEYQHQGCPAHTLHPDLVPWAMKDSDHEWTATFEIDGTNVQNGENGFSSQELIANASGCTNAIVEKMKQIWPGAKVVK